MNDVINPVEHTTEITEVCPECMTEVVKKWDVATQGFEIVCPTCGRAMMICSECLYNGGDYNGDMFCDWTDEHGCFRMKKNNSTL